MSRGMLGGAEPAAPTGQHGAVRLAEIYASPDAGGVSVADIDGDGLLDILVPESTTKNVTWFQQGPLGTWTRRVLGATAGEPEGSCLGDFNGAGELAAAVADQGSGTITVWQRDAPDPTGTWTQAVLVTDRIQAQTVRAFDIDGDGRPEIVYSWEGNVNGQGGIHWLDYTGPVAGDLLDPDNWTDHVLTQANGAWWIAHDRADFDDDNVATDLLFGCRQQYNPQSLKGVFFARPGADVTQPWTRHAIVDDDPGDWLHTDFGDFLGSGRAHDVVAHTQEQTTPATVYAHPGGDGTGEWTAAVTLEVARPSPATSWNVRRVPRALIERDRDGILHVHENDAAHIFEWTGSRWQRTPLFGTPYGHALDQNLVWADVDEDGIDELVVGDSGGNRLFVLDFAVAHRSPEPFARAFRKAAQNGVGPNTWTKVAFDQGYFGEGISFDLAGRFTVSEPGLYHVDANMQAASLGDALVALLGVFRGGVAGASNPTKILSRRTTGAAGAQGAWGSATILMGPGDVLEIGWQHTGPSNVNLSAGEYVTWVDVHRVA